MTNSAPSTSGGTIKENDRKNNFGVLRLLFAALVVLSHSPECVDGNRHREILTRIFGTLSFGDLAVDGFFIISGYLIVKSWLSLKDGRAYLWRRVLRIYPGFIVASVVSLLVVGPLAGGSLLGLDFVGQLKSLIRLITLGSPEIPGAFAHLPYPSLNGPMWTISYEFRCYLLIMFIGLFNIARHRYIIALLFFAMLAASVFVPDAELFHWIESAVGRLHRTMRLSGLFGMGVIFYIFRDRIIYNPVLALVAMFGLVAMMFTPFAEVGVGSFGAYLIFWTALHLRSPFLASINSKTDLSYGLYLYAWPLGSLVILEWPGVSPWEVFPLATIGGLGAAYLSWRFVEEPALRQKDRVPGRPSAHSLVPPPAIDAAGTRPQAPIEPGG